MKSSPTEPICALSPSSQSAILGSALSSLKRTHNAEHFAKISRPTKKIRLIVSSHLRTSSSQGAAVAAHTKKGPIHFLSSLVRSHGIEFVTQPSLLIRNYFIEATEDDLASYSADVINAIRSRNVKALREFHRSGRSLQCCNRFGESLIHMACRRGFTDVVSFLLKEAGVSLRVRDDYGRTPMHDACWTAEPNFELMGLIIEAEPQLLFISDKRGHSPLDYARRDHWEKWISFLEENKRNILLKLKA